LNAKTLTPAARRRAGPGFSDLFRRLLVVPAARYPLSVEPAPLTEIPPPETLTLLLGHSNARGSRLSPSVIADHEVAVGQTLGTRGNVPVVPSPRAGRVQAVRQAPDVRGGKPGLAVLLEPSAYGDAPLPPLDAGSAAADAVRDRLRETGIRIDLRDPTDPLVVLAADPEPGITAALRVFVDDPSAAVRATALLARAAGSKRAVLAVLEPRAAAVRGAAADAGIEVLPLAAEYPATLPEAVVRHVASNGAQPIVIPLAQALAALEAVEQGRVPASRVITILGPDGASLGNFRVPLGARLGDVLAAAGLEPGPGDRVVTGGPFRGLAQYSLDAAVDNAVDALLLIRKGTFRDWSDEPCVSCGACLDVCPEQLAAHHLSRYTEFGLFDQVAEHGLSDCIECGLCATVCPARRPMLQHIRLAKSEVAAAAARLAAAEVEPAAPEPEPIPVPVATATED
jgi:electron transport complex protein RnfC